MFNSLGGQFGHGHVITMAPRHMVQCSLKVQGGVSFFFKMESARPVPFLPQGEKGNGEDLGGCLEGERSQDQEHLGQVEKWLECQSGHLQCFPG